MTFSRMSDKEFRHALIEARDWLASIQASKMEEKASRTNVIGPVNMDDKPKKGAAAAPAKPDRNPFDRWWENCMEENKTPSQALVGRRVVAVLEDGDFRTLVFEGDPAPRAFVIRLADLTSAEVTGDI